MGPGLPHWVVLGLTWAFIALLALASYWVCVKVLTPVVNLITLKTETEWDDDLLNEHVLKAFSQLAPAILVACMLPESFDSKTVLYLWIVRLTRLYILWAATRLILVFIKGLQQGVDRRHMLRSHNLELLRQTIAFFIIAVALIIGVSILIDRNPMAILTALGASAAVLMLVFKDTLLNFTAGIQLTVNRMLRRGDWIVTPKGNINGEVVELKLVTVKIRNWDNSIVTVPPYTLVTDSFQNYRNMRQSGARRISRSVLLDLSTVRVLTSEETRRLQESGYATEEEITSTAPGPGGQPVNTGLLRRYLERYLASHPDVISNRSDATLMVRQLQATPQGLPLELYFFTPLTAWKACEDLQSDIFDHIYSLLPIFGLRAYQAPAASDFSKSTSSSWP